MSRNLVVCLDGTSNEPETDVTNVARLFDMAIKDYAQLVYYDPGVGTMGARRARRVDDRPRRRCPDWRL
jgi:uncharacterized protein (DUF2235 family)